MGYSISARFSTPEERNAMWAFLQGLDWNKGAFGIEPVKGEDLAYPPRAPGEVLIGFNGREIPLSAWAVVAWMATQSTYRYQGERSFYYDSQRHVLVLPGQRAGRHNATEADARGLLHLPSPVGILARVGQALDRRHDKRDVLAWVEEMDGKWAARSAVAPTLKRAPR